MDIIRMYQDFSVDFRTEEHKHCREGWVNVECPFCSNLPGSNPGYHLGWNLDEEYYTCWRCGWHPPVKTVALLLKVSQTQAMNIMASYGVNLTTIKKRPKDALPFRFPSNMSEMSIPHRNYLNNRHFNSYEIERLWLVKATGPISKLDNIDYRHRILIPYFWNGQVVSFDTRDITGKHPMKYLACPLEREVIPHKRILYGNQEYWTETGICVEGCTDVWRLGVRSFATSGINYTHAQVKIMAQTFKRIAVIFDSEPQAQEQARKLVAELKFRGIEAWVVKIKGDPAEMSQKEASTLVSSIIYEKDTHN